MAASSLYCPKCGGKNETGAQVCFACGESLLAAASSALPGSAAPAPRVTLELPLVQRVIRQRYRIAKRVGEGGFGAVYQAEDLTLGNRLVAVKEMSYSGQLATQELKEAADAFRREAILLAGISHPSLPRIHDHFSEDGHWYLVMEFIHGETLEKRLERSPQKRLSVKEALQLGIKLCEVLEYLHTRPTPIIFRDLKPGNVMLTPDGDVYLIDFGIARLFKPGQQKDTMAFGSPGYAAPEQYGKAQTTPRSDVFSLVVLLHQMVTGNDPSDTPFRFAPLTMPRPTGLGTFIGQMVNLDEYKRPPSIGIVKRELERLAAAWAERQRGSMPSVPLPPYQAATGFLPVVPPRSTGFVPPQAGPHWRPAPPVTVAPPSGTIPSPFQQTGMIRSAGPAYPYPAPSMPPAPRPARTRKRFWWWGLLLLSIILIGLLFVGLSVGFVALLHAHVSRVPAASFGAIFTVAWSHADDRIASGGVDDRIHIWDAATGIEILTYQGHSDSIDWLAWSPNGAYIASASDDKTVQVWSATTGALIYTYSGHSDRVRGPAWSPDGTRIASASDDHTVQVWDAFTGDHEYTYRGHTDAVRTVEWSADGKYIASGGDDQTVQVWDAQTGKTITTYRGHTGDVNQLAWSPTEDEIASVSADKTMQVWDAISGKLESSFPYFDDAVETVAWSPDGLYLAAGGEDKTVQVRDALTGEWLYTYTGHSNAVWDVTWSPNSQRVASASLDGTVQIWDAQTGDDVFTYPTNS